MIRLPHLLVVLFTAAPIAASEQLQNVPDIAQAEIARRGDFVERVQPQRPIGQRVDATALRPPADDSHKWYITLITTPNCGACQRLKVDFARSPHLQAFVNVEDHKESWAHYNVYSSADQTQAWRFRKIKIRAYPTLIVQPPRNGQYGDARTVVVQLTGYGGDPEQLAHTLRNAIIGYAQRIQQRRQEQPDEPAAAAEPEPAADADAIGQAPPFAPPEQQPLVPQIDFPPQPRPANNPLAPQQPQIDLGSLFSALFGGLVGGGTTTNILLLAITGLAGIRTWRKMRGKELLLDDEAYANLVLVLKQFAGQIPQDKGK